jgi:hypothetical protein
MTFIDADALYALLPSYIRVQDQTQGGGALQALVGVIAGQAQVIDASLDQQYDDQFIETCSTWVIPYIGDLIGFTPLQPLGPNQRSATRAEVADTISYRQRKGTVAMLEQLCVDVTGWPGIAVEYFSRLSTTQYIRNHRRLANTIVDVHSPMTAVDIGGPFDLRLAPAALPGGQRGYLAGLEEYRDRRRSGPPGRDQSIHVRPVRRRRPAGQPAPHHGPAGHPAPRHRPVVYPPRPDRRPLLPAVLPAVRQ